MLLPTMFASVLRRPRCDMPTTHSCDAGGGGALQQLIEHRDHRFAAFQRKPLVAFEAIVEKQLESFGFDEIFQNAPARRGLERPLIRRIGFDALLQPAALLGIVDVHVLHAHAFPRRWRAGARSRSRRRA